MYNRVKELEHEIETQNKTNYKELNQLYAKIAAANPEYFNEYHLSFMLSFPALAQLVIKRCNKDLERTIEINERVYYMYTILAISLVNGDLDSYNNIIVDSKHYDVGSSVLRLDFRKIEKLITLLDSDYVRILADEHAGIEKCKQLSQGIEDTVKNKFGVLWPKPTILLLSGKGASPYYSELNSAYLMVGHYRGTEYERRIMSTSIIHELTHTSNKKYQRFSLQQEKVGNFKFFDEAIATINGYSILEEADQYGVCFTNVASIISRFSGLSTRDIMDRWLEFLYSKAGISTYDYACSLVSFINKRFAPKTGLAFLREWLSQKEYIPIMTYFTEYFGQEFDEVEKNWISEIQEFSKYSEYVDKTKILLVQVEKDKAVFTYHSAFELNVGTNIYCVTNKNHLLESNALSRDYRFSHEGRFAVQMRGDEEEISIYVVFKNTLQRIKIPLLIDKKVTN